MTMAALGVGALGLAACSGPSSVNSQGSSTGASAIDFSGVKPASEITFWTNNPGGSGDVTSKICTDFKAKEGIAVRIVPAGSSYEEVAQKFQTALTGQDTPDVIIGSDVWWFRYYMQDAIIPLDDVLKAAKVDVTAYRKGLIDDYRYKDHLYALPFARSTPLFYYNKSHFKAAGLPDRAPRTWDEWRTWAGKLQNAKTGAQYAYQFPSVTDYAGWTLQNILWGYGGGWSKKDSFDITCDSDNSIQALTFVRDAVLTDKWAGVSSNESTDDMAAGACSATIGSTGSLVGVQKAVGNKFEVGVGFLPGGPVTTHSVCPTGGAGVAICSRSSKDKQLAAAKFIGFLTNAENTIDLSAATGYMPVCTTSDTSKLLKENPLIGQAIKQLDATRPQDYARVFVPGGDQEIAKAVASVIQQGGELKPTMSKLRATLEGIYTSQVKPHV
ncbi:ABC transporter substrate-binding protein [Cutibacterium sp. WCA-380-WT-3A]|uniref:ABC transporter substrate-binding protein n=2 Tax=Cutibacterium porci TaxID=2605781 RepID=A0A7K0J8U4_9ACTN|nr:ABC transporter substrate-binding protein [Cutibacterium porci]